MPQTTDGFLEDHWVPIPDWTPERAMLACYVTVAGQERLLRQIERYHEALADVPELGPVDPRWLHITVQGVGFLDVLGRESLTSLADVLRPRLAATPAPTAVVGHARPGRTAVIVPFDAADGFRRVRETIRGALDDALGVPEPYALPGQTSTYHPHLTIAYAHERVSRALIRERLDVVPRDPFEAEFSALSVLALRRTARTWEWTDEIRLRVGDRSLLDA